MKYLNTVLLIVIAVALGANFYFDHKRDNAYRADFETLVSSTSPAKKIDPSPFDKAPTNPMEGPQKPQVADQTMISFEHTARDFGRAESGPTYTDTFKYKNTGKANLYISAADASCGCTVPTWSRDAIKPGESGEIIVNFDSKGRQGEQLKTVTVTTNTEPNKNVLTLHADLYLKIK
jgi:hypothetical protein